MIAYDADAMAPKSEREHPNTFNDERSVDCPPVLRTTRTTPKNESTTATVPLESILSFRKTGANMATKIVLVATSIEFVDAGIL